jgi:hypothetical protein
MSSDFVEVILPSFPLPVREKYSIEEAALILDRKPSTILQWGRNYKNQCGRLRIKIEPDKTITFETFEKFFEPSLFE